MKKSNIIILAIAVIVSAFLLWLWYYLGFNQVDNPFDLVLSIVWWVCIVGVAVAITQVDRKRRQRMRTCYVANNVVYNPEKGTVGFPYDADPTEVIQDILERLEYKLDIQEMPSRQSTSFIYVVRTEAFKMVQPKDGEQVQPEPEWSGNVSLAMRPDDEPMRFENRAQLQAILAGEHNRPSSSAPTVPLQPAGAMA